MIAVADLLRPSNDLLGAYSRMQVINALFYANDAGDFASRLTALGMNAPIVVYSPFNPGTHVPAFAMFAINGNPCVFMSGIETYDQGVDIWEGYVGPSGFSPNLNRGRNPVFFNWAQAVLPFFRQAFPNPHALYCAGHSGGGATLYKVALQTVIENGNFRGAQVAMFGTPKLGDNEPAIPGALTTRWFNSDDPVPLIPPSVGGPAIWQIALTIQQVKALNYFNNLTVGIQINPDGTLVSRREPDGIPAPDYLAAGVWLFNLAVGQENAHWTTQYVQRLTVAVLAGGMNPQPLPPQPAIVPPVPLTTNDVNAIFQAIMQALGTAPVDGQNQGAWTGTPTATTSAREKHAWRSVIQGRTFAVASNRRRARHLSRVMNELIRSLQRQDSVDLTVLVEALQRYLAGLKR